MSFCCCCFTIISQISFYNFCLGKKNVSDSSSVELLIPLENGSANLLTELKLTPSRAALQPHVPSVTPGVADTKLEDFTKFISLSTILPQTVTDPSKSSEETDSDPAPDDLVVTTSVQTISDFSEEVPLHSESQTEQIEVGPIRTSVDAVQSVETETSVTLTKEKTHLGIQPTKESMEAKTDIKLTTVVIPKESFTDHHGRIIEENDDRDVIPDRSMVTSSIIAELDVTKESKTFLHETATTTLGELISYITSLERKKASVTGCTLSHEMPILVDLI